jgi:hypothetical protein
VHFTVITPYVFLLILLLRGVFLDGASDGLRYFTTGIDPVLTKQIENKMAHLNDTYPNNTTSARQALEVQYAAATSPLAKLSMLASHYILIFLTTYTSIQKRQPTIYNCLNLEIQLQVNTMCGPTPLVR